MQFYFQCFSRIDNSRPACWMSALAPCGCILHFIYVSDTERALGRNLFAHVSQSQGISKFFVRRNVLRSPDVGFMFYGKSIISCWIVNWCWLFLWPSSSGSFWFRWSKSLQKKKKCLFVCLNTETTQIHIAPALKYPEQWFRRVLLINSKSQIWIIQHN